MEGEIPPQERDKEIINQFQSLDRNIERIEAIAAQSGLEMVTTNQNESTAVFYFKEPNGDAAVPPEDMLDVFAMTLQKTDFTLHEITTQDDNVVEIRPGVLPERYLYMITKLD